MAYPQPLSTHPSPTPPPPQRRPARVGDPYRSAHHPWDVLRPAADRATATERVYSFLVAYQREHGIPPTLDEIADHMGYRSLSSPHYHLRKLEAEGRIKRPRNQHRVIRIVDDGGDGGDGGDGVAVDRAKDAPAAVASSHAPHVRQKRATNYHTANGKG